MTMIYAICKILSFPGTYLRAFLEHLTAKASGCMIESDGYIRFDELSGHIEHTFPLKKGGAVAMALVPGIFHFIFGVFFSVAGLVPLALLKVDFQHPLMCVIYILFTFLGISMFCNLFPLVDDALFCRERIYGKDGANIVAKILLFIPVHICVLGAYIERYCVNYIIFAAFLILIFIK